MARFVVVPLMLRLAAGIRSESSPALSSTGFPGVPVNRRVKRWSLLHAFLLFRNSRGSRTAFMPKLSVLLLSLVAFLALSVLASAQIENVTNSLHADCGCWSRLHQDVVGDREPF